MMKNNERVSSASYYPPRAVLYSNIDLPNRPGKVIFVFTQKIVKPKLVKNPVYTVRGSYIVESTKLHPKEETSADARLQSARSWNI